MKHATPGPWHVGHEYRVIGGDSEAVCFGNRANESNSANARLIAAAPEAHQCNIDALYFLEHPAVHDVFRADPELYAKLEAAIINHRTVINNAEGRE